MRSHAANALVMQSGGCTAVLNRSLWGLVDEAARHAEIGNVYGARHGIEGVLGEKLVDLGAQPASLWRRIAGTPAAALGTTRYSPSEPDMPLILDALERHGIGYCFIIGGNDSAETGRRIAESATSAGLALSVVNVPKTIDNDLVLTDHAPGYGSAARFVAAATMGAGMDAEAMATASPITIIEVMGRDAGWLAAASVLAKNDERDAPHVLGLPEAPVDAERFCGLIEDAYRRFGFAVAVVAENTRGKDGVLGESDEPTYVDPFGHPYYDGPARYLARLVSQRLGVRVRDEKPGTIQRSLAATVSPVDGEEAEAAGRAAVRYALEGRSGGMVTLARSGNDPYRCAFGFEPLERIAGRVRRMPDDFLDPERYFVTDSFAEYARPLIGRPLPPVPRLR